MFPSWGIPRELAVQDSLILRVQSYKYFLETANDCRYFFSFTKFFVTLHPVMTPLEYKQLKAFAKQDGALLSLLWIGSFICYIKGLTYPSLGTAALLLIISSPFFAANRLRHFRDVAREGAITFLRGYAYTILIFFYAGLLLAAVIYVYFAFIDDGFLLGKFNTLVHSTEGAKILDVYCMRREMEEGLKQLAEMRPIDFALNMLTINITSGLFLGLPIAALMKKEVIIKN
jgi:hypothetical protein